MKTYTLSNGVTIPKIGFGTWQIPEGEEAYNSVSFALKAGYTHIDMILLLETFSSIEASRL